MKITALNLAIGACAAARPTWRELSPAYTFERYVADFSKPWAAGSAEYAEHAALFASELAKVLAHNARNGTSYKMGVNALSDATDIHWLLLGAVASLMTPPSLPTLP